MRRLLVTFALMFAVIAIPAAAAGAQYPIDGSPNPPVDVGGDIVTNPGGPDQLPTVVDRTPAVAGDVTTRGLPVTGGDLVGLTVLGLGAIAVGGLLVSQRRRTVTA